ncbi:uncharacterized protein LOC131934862 [Physella acuta]|uniref:uncharacterized protein LOC131934862 n=1 Tax=Physella acuta TaxID=109671 RepID=UPI0027DE94A0|nr:uncharacterized protein LOC131934862 [Physella acuta]
MEKNEPWFETVQWNLITANGTTITIANCDKSKTCFVIYNQTNFYASNTVIGVHNFFRTNVWSISLKVNHLTREMGQLKCLYGFFQRDDDCSCSFDFGVDIFLILKIAIPLGVGVLIIVLIATCCIRKRRRRIKNRSAQTRQSSIFTVQRERHAGNQTSSNTDTSPCVHHLPTSTHGRPTASRKHLNQRDRQHSQDPPSYSSVFTSDGVPRRQTTSHHNVQPLQTTCPQNVHPRLLISLDIAHRCHNTTDTNVVLRTVCPTCQLPVQTRELQQLANPAL